MNLARSVQILAIGVAVLALEGTAAAQPGLPPGPPSQPALSPYLNMLRNGGNPAVNYYGMVRPQQQFQSSLQTLDGQFNSLNNQMTNGTGRGSASSGGLITGTGFGFQNHRSYFLNVGGMGGMGGGGGMGAGGVGGATYGGGSLGGNFNANFSSSFGNQSFGTMQFGR